MLTIESVTKIVQQETAEYVRARFGGLPSEVVHELETLGLAAVVGSLFFSRANRELSRAELISWVKRVASEAIHAKIENIKQEAALGAEQ